MVTKEEFEKAKNEYMNVCRKHILESVVNGNATCSISCGAGVNITTEFVKGVTICDNSHRLLDCIIIGVSDSEYDSIKSYTNNAMDSKRIEALEKELAELKARYHGDNNNECAEHS